MAIAKGLQGVASVAAQVEKGNRAEDDFKLKLAENREKQKAINAYNEKQVWRLKLEDEIRKNNNPEDYLDVMKASIDEYDNERMSGESAVFSTNYMQFNRIADFNALGRMATKMRDDIETEYYSSQKAAAESIIARDDELSPVDLVLLVNGMREDQIMGEPEIDDFEQKYIKKYSSNHLAGLEPEEAIAVLADEDHPITLSLTSEEKNSLESRALTRLGKKQEVAMLESTLSMNSIRATLSTKATRGMSAQEAMTFITSNYTNDAELKFAMDVHAMLYGEIEPNYGSEEDIRAENQFYKDSIQQLIKETSFYTSGDEDITPKQLRSLADKAAQLGSEIQEAYSNGLLKKNQMREFIFDISTMSSQYLDLGDNGERDWWFDREPSLAQHTLSEILDIKSRYNNNLTSKDLASLSYGIKMRVIKEIEPSGGHGLFESPPLKPALSEVTTGTFGFLDLMKDDKKKIDKIIEEEFNKVIEGKGVFSDKDKEDFRNNTTPQSQTPAVTPSLITNNLESYKAEKGFYPSRKSIIEAFQQAGLSPEEAAKQADRYE
jgi:hypothetical protein